MTDMMMADCQFSFPPSPPPTKIFHPSKNISPRENILTPPPSPEVARTSVSETAAQLIFSVGDLARLEGLTVEQVKSHWRQLFLLGCAQHMTVTELNQLQANTISSSSSSSYLMASQQVHLTLFLRSLTSLRSLNLSPTDFALLRAALLRTGSNLYDVPSSTIQQLFFRDFIQSHTDLDTLLLNIVKQ